LILDFVLLVPWLFSLLLLAFDAFTYSSYTGIQMHRFFTDKITGDRAVIADREQLHHIKDVLRLKPGDEVDISDNTGCEYSGVIVSISKQNVELKVALKKTVRENPLKLTVACAVPKNTRFDDIVDFLTQLGVERIIPMRTERVIVRLDSVRAEEKHKRWEKIAQSAARQSQRSRIPIIDPVTDIEEVIKNSAGYSLKLIPHLSGERKLIRDVLAEVKPQNIIVLIGPEGDFTPGEVALALRNGFTAVSLGDTVLRVAAAAMAAASYIKFALEG
jgi:16S rRNA (uracil1498-N3)-methyltransferase